MRKITIKDVWYDDVSCDKNGMGADVIVTLDNGQRMIIRLDEIANRPLFSDIVMGRCDTAAQTDGERVYWSNGASLSLDEIMRMLQAEPKARDRPYEKQ